MTRRFTTLESPLGELLITADGRAVTGLHTAPWPTPRTARADDDPVLVAAATQLREYFAGERTAFDLPLAAAGTPFQQSVWAELVRIPYGETRTYGALAATLGRPGAARAVGHANGRNPIAIVVPCHRVIGSSGALTGYAGGLERKRALLELESQRGG